jgi:DNA-binding NtrC family response regulator
MEKREDISMFIIDDDTMLAMALKSDLERTFEDHNLQISVFATGEDSREHIPGKPDLVILDYYPNSKNPGAMNSVEIIDLVRQKSPDTEVILIAGEEHSENIAGKAMQHGAHDYIMKDDYLFRKLNMTVLQCLKLKRLKTEVRAQRVPSSRFSSGLLMCWAGIMPF